MENIITFCAGIPDFKDGSEIYYFVTFKFDDSKIAKEISDVDLIVFSRLNYEETVKAVKDISISEKFDVYVRNIVEKIGIPYKNAKWTIRYVGISSDNLFESKVIDFKNGCE